VTTRIEETTITTSNNNQGTSNSNYFDDWIANAPEEITEWQQLEIVGKIPDYVLGTLVRNGGAHWGGSDHGSSSSSSSNNNSSPETTEELAHLFDGLAKLSAYRINGQTQQVQFQNPFIQSKFYQQFRKKGRIPTAFGVGPRVRVRTTAPQGSSSSNSSSYNNHDQQQHQQPETTISRIQFSKRRLLRALANLRIFDNACVSVWDFDPLGKNNDQEQQQPTISALTDASPRAVLSLPTLKTLSSSNMPPSRLRGLIGYPIIETAHPMYSLHSDDTYNVAITLKPASSGPVLTLLKETAMGERRVVGSCPMRRPQTPAGGRSGHENQPQEGGGIPYVHSFGLSQNYAVVVVQPLRFHLLRNLRGLLEKGLLQSLESIDHTRVIVFELSTGQVVLDNSIAEPVYFFHTVSTVEHQSSFENKNSVSIRLAGYHKPEIKCGMRHTKERAKIPEGARFVDITCDLSEQKVNVDWIQMQNSNPCFELPVTRYLRAHGGCSGLDLPPQGKHPDHVYAFGAALGSCKSGNDYNAWALHKYNPNRRVLEASFERENWYFSEPIFVADPNGSREDDGVLLSQIYDGDRRESALLVLDARDMSQLALAWTGTRCPMDFHGGFFPAKSSQSS